MMRELELGTRDSGLESCVTAGTAAICAYQAFPSPESRFPSPGIPQTDLHHG